MWFWQHAVPFRKLANKSGHPPMKFIDLDTWRAGGSHFTWRNNSIYYRNEGKSGGDTLLLIHGFPTASWDWHPIWPALAHRFHLLTLDMLGFGFSAKPRDFPYSIMAQADLFEALLAKAGVQHYRILAHDYGDTVAQELLARNGQRNQGGPELKAICFLNGGLFPETHRPLFLQKVLASPLGPLLAKLTTYAKFKANFERICAKPLAEAELAGMWALLNENSGRAVMPELIRYMAERRTNRARWVGALQTTQLPLQLIDGVDDPISGSHLVARFRELVPQGRVLELPGVGHYPHVEAPEAVLAGVLDFFGE